MSQQPDLELLSRTERITLAIQAMKSDASLSQRRAAAAYNVPESTLRRQRAKPASTRVIYPNSSRLQRHEEDAIVQYIKKLDERGFAPTLSYVQEMANQLLAARGGGQTGDKWAYRFIRRRAEIKSQVSRPRVTGESCAATQLLSAPGLTLYAMSKPSMGS
jgi:hypothetical protein